MGYFVQKQGEKVHLCNYNFFLILETFIELLLQCWIFTSGIHFFCHLDSFKHPSLFKTFNDGLLLLL